MTDIFGQTVSVRKPKGVFIMDGVEVADLQQCCHCNMQFVMLKGSGRRRGFCTRCHQITCGRKGCDECVPFEQKLDEFEKGKRQVL